MGHGLYTQRDFQISEEVAWHRLTTVKTPEQEDFPAIEAQDIMLGDQPLKIGGEIWQVPVSLDDGNPCGDPFNSKTYTLFTPRAAWDYVGEVLAGTGYQVKSIGML